MQISVCGYHMKVYNLACMFMHSSLSFFLSSVFCFVCFCFFVIVVFVIAFFCLIVLWFCIQDNFGRLHDRNKETPKATKQLSRLFPNKVTILPPQVP